MKSFILCSLAVLVFCCCRCLPAQEVAPAVERQRPIIRLDGDWDVAVDANGSAPRAAWAKALPDPQHITLPCAWERHPLTKNCPGAVWYSHPFTLPAKLEKTGAMLVVENAVGAMEVYLDGALLATYLGNGLTRRVRVHGDPGSHHRLTIRLDRGGLPDTVRRSAPCGLGPVRLELLAPAWLDALYTLVDPVSSAVTVRYRLASDAPESAVLKLELLDTGSRRVIYRKPSVGVELVAGMVDGEYQLTPKRLQPWSTANPQTYRLRATLLIDGHVLDQREVPCGACALTMNGDGLLRINGEPNCFKGLRLPGGVPLLYQSSMRQTLEDELVLMRKAGFNTIMADGFALSEELLTVADRLGLMVIAEMPPGQEPAQPATPATHSDLQVIVEECGSHPCLVAWSLTAATTPPGTVADMRALDPTRLILYRDGEHSRALFAPPNSIREFVDLNEASMDAEHWRAMLQRAETEKLPVLASSAIAGQPMTGPVSDPLRPSTWQKKYPGLEHSAGAVDADPQNEDVRWRQVQDVVAGIRRAPRPLGYFISPKSESTLTGLSSVDGTPTSQYVYAQAYNQPCLIALQIVFDAAQDHAPRVRAALINDLHLTGTFQLYQLLITPDNKTFVCRKELTLNGKERVKDISAFAGFSIGEPGEYRLHLQLTRDNEVIAGAQETLVVPAKGVGK
ncbi:MAG: glycoside hydrolase family 2 TIM barrel-domain containing protein [Armatimonadota bacterium]